MDGQGTQWENDSTNVVRFEERTPCHGDVTGPCCACAVPVLRQCCASACTAPVQCALPMLCQCLCCACAC